MKYISVYLTIFDLPINHCLKTSLVNTFDDNRGGARWTANVIARDFRALSEAEITARRGDTRQISIRASRRAAQDWMPYCIYRASRIIFNGVAFLACTHIPRLSSPPPREKHPLLQQHSPRFISSTMLSQCSLHFDSSFSFRLSSFSWRWCFFESFCLSSRWYRFIEVTIYFSFFA